MKNLVLNNFTQHEMDEELKSILEKKFIENREIWYQFQTGFYPENREATIARFLQLEKGDNIVCQTTFLDYQQLELIAILLTDGKMPAGLNIYICRPDLKEDLQEYFDKLESDITPESDKYNDSPPLRRAFKETMNNIVKATLVKHNVFHLSRHRGITKQIHLQDFS